MRLEFPLYLEAGSIRLPLHVLFETAGIFAGFRYFLYLRNKEGDKISTGKRTWILIGAIFGSVFGSRLLGGLEDIEALLQSKNILLHFFQNKTILGGLLGGLVGVELTKKIIGERKSSGDLFTFPLLLAMIIGRIGCFSMGVHEETYGIVTSFPLAINLGDGMLRHPVTLYEILFLVIFFIGLKAANKNYHLAAGGKFKVFMIAYLFFRFFLDFIKPHYNLVVGLSTLQLACIGGLLYYSNYIVKPKKLLTAYA